MGYPPHNINFSESLKGQLEYEKHRNAKLVAALEKIAKLEGITTEAGRIACKALVSIPCK